MKQALILITALFVCLGLVGCGNDQYAIERDYYRIKQQSRNIFTNPQASPPFELDKTVEVFKKFVAKNPKTNLAVKADFEIVNLYLVKTEYELARKQLKEIINKYKDNDLIKSEAVFAFGNSFEKEGKLAEALEQYRKILKDYPLTPRGLDVPIYIARYYQAKYQPEKMIAAYQEAIAHFKGLANKYPGSRLNYAVDKLIVSCYAAIKDWQAVINTCESMLSKYKGKVMLDDVMFNMAVIYGQQLKNNEKAKEILLDLVSQYPKSRIVPAANALIRKLSVPEQNK